MQHTRTQRRLWIAVLVGCALAGAADAQGDATIGFQDAALDTMPPPASAWADIVAGSLALSEDGTTILATLTLSALPEMQPGVAYLVVFSDDAGREWFVGAATAPTLNYLYGSWISDDEGPGDSSDTGGSYVAGPGGSITAEFPVSYLRNATKIMAPRGLTGDIKTGASPAPLPLPPVVYFDDAQGQGELALPPRETRASPGSAQPGVAPTEAAAGSEASAAPPPASPTPSTSVPAPGGFATLAAIAGALLVARRHA